MDLNTAGTSHSNRLGSADVLNLIDIALLCRETVSRARCDIFFNVRDFPNMHLAVFARACKEEALIICDSYSVNWIAMLI